MRSLGSEKWKVYPLFSKEGYNIKARVNANKDVSITVDTQSYLCGAFFTSSEYLFSPKTRVAIMLPSIKVFTTSN